jgi:hypothetical protein
MTALRSRRASALAALTSVALLLAVAGPASADEPVSEFTLPAGLACADFDLQVAAYGPGSQVVRRFDRTGGTVLNLKAGTGKAMTFTNVSSGASISTDANGAVDLTATYPDGSQRMMLTGHNVVILFPADGGPSTTLHVGRVRIDVAPDGVWTVRTIAGTKFDICAAIA